MRTSHTTKMLLSSMVCAMVALPSVAVANINLEWRVASQNVRVGDTVEVGLYAVSDNASNQPFTALDVIFSWDPAVLELVGKIDNGFPWPVSHFPNDDDLDGLNADCGPDTFCNGNLPLLPYNDGDALYQAFLFFLPNIVPQATPEGLLVTTILFTALSPAPITELRILESAGMDTFTRVVNVTPDEGTQIVTGTLGALTLSIAACGTRGDFDGNCRVDLVDFPQFPPCLTGPDGGPVGPACGPADFDGDNDADLHDIGALQREFTGS